MQSRTRFAWAPAVPGLAAGAIGAALIDAYLLITVVAIAHRTTVAGFYEFVAASAIGKNAIGDASAIWLGVALHIAVSLGWGVGYAYTAARMPQLRVRPVTSGIVFGIVVMLAMQLVEVAGERLRVARHLYARERVRRAYVVLRHSRRVRHVETPGRRLTVRAGTHDRPRRDPHERRTSGRARAPGALPRGRQGECVRSRPRAGAARERSPVASRVSACIARTKPWTLRDAGVEEPILVLGPVDADERAAAHAARAAIALWSDGAFRTDIARLAARSGSPVRVHAKVDTGVTRLGMEASAAPHLIASYLDDAALDVTGVFTHLAAAEELESAYTLGQLDRFERALEPVAARLAGRGALRHAAASAAAMLFPKSRLDAIRAGIATYGIWPSDETRHAVAGALVLAPALSWRTELVVVRDVEAGRSVGYGCTFETTRPSRIAVIPIGYAEGVPRGLSNVGSALVAGRLVPFVGRICMNMAFLDVTDVPEAVPGSRVTLVGSDGDASIDANACAEAAGTIGYELTARLPADVPRRYVGDRTFATEAIATARSSVPS